MNFVPVQSFGNYVEAHIVMGNLQEHNINCWLKDEYTVTIDPILSNAVGGIKLMVADVQVARAIELLREVRQEKEKQCCCPRCNSHDIKHIPAPNKPVNLFKMLAAWLSGNGADAANGTWHCCTCDMEFEEPVELTRQQI